MKRTLILAIALCSCALFAGASTAQRQRGTIVRMRMAECLVPQHGFMAALSGQQRQQGDELCPEYVLVADKVVYVIVGKTSSALIPLAESTQFRLQKKELLIRIDDENRETGFLLREMVLRSEWDRVHPNVAVDENDEASRPRLTSSGDTQANDTGDSRPSAAR